MTNRSSFELENIGHACYLVVGAWLSNFCHGFSNFGHLQLKNGVSTKVARSSENRGRLLFF